MTPRNVFSAFVAIALLVGSTDAQEKPARQEPTKQADEKPAPMLKVTEARLGTGVDNRILVGEDGPFALNQRVYLWLEVTGGPAEDIAVTWTHGEHVFTTKLRVGGPTWHTWAYKTAAFGGSWKVSVEDAAGNELKSLQFTVGEAPAK